jgi:hypothetical protein
MGLGEAEGNSWPEICRSSDSLHLSSTQGLNNNDRRCRSLCKHIFAARVQFRLRCCRPAGVASEAQVCDIWAPVQILAVVWTFVTVIPYEILVKPVQKEKVGCLNGPSSAGVRQTCQVSIGNRGAREGSGQSGKPGLDDVCLRHTQWIGLTLK